jgi:NADH-quinone oxidoreductase subunit N
MSIDWTLLSPHLTIAAFALVVLVLGTFRTKPLAGWLAVIGCAITAYLSITHLEPGRLWGGMFLWDQYSAFFCALLALAALLVCMASAGGRVGGEYYSLLLLSTLGMMLMVTSANLLMLYLSLELATTTLFVLAGYDRGRPRSGEAALKFVIVGASSSAVLLFGASWIYGAVGSLSYAAMSRFLTDAVPAYAWGGMVLVIAAFGFKLAAAPFHLWAPDVYEGSPSAVTAFLSTASKGAGFMALFRLLLQAMGPAEDTWVAIAVILSVITIVLGNVVALVQTNVKRLLAYSGVGQAGFMLMAVAAASKVGLMALALYLLLYVFANVGAFLCVYAATENSGDHDLMSYDGLSRRSPMLAFAFLIFLLSLAGIPPLAGFVGKFFLFAAAMDAGLWGLVLLAAVASTLSLYYYLIVARRMYIHAPREGAQIPQIAKPLSFSIGVCLFMTAAIGLYPAPWIELGQWVATLVQSR